MSIDRTRVKPPALPVGPDAAASDRGSSPGSGDLGSIVYEPRGVLREMGALFGEILRGPAARRTRWLMVLILLVLIGNMAGQVRLNIWNGSFFDALEAKDTFAFVSQFKLFFLIIAALLTLVVAQTWLQEIFKIHIRERMSHLLLSRWLEPGRAYRLSFVGETGTVPDQRIQEDCRLFSEFTTELGVGMLQSALLLVTFIGVLWSLSSFVSLNIGGQEWQIPGYMVWVAIAYAGLGSALTWWVCRPLIRLNTWRYAREADLRFALVRVNENAEGVALYQGEADERRNLDAALTGVLQATRRLSGALARLTWITSGYGWIGIVVPIVAGAPGYFSGRLSFGELMMVVGAFIQVQSALRYFVDNFPRLADWRSSVVRINMFRNALRELEIAAQSKTRISIEPHPSGELAFDGLVISLVDGSTVIEEATAEIHRGDRVLIKGESGSGKSILFRAIAGLWPWGSGTIQVPSASEQMFLPQRPYLPLGTLRAAVCYPGGANAFEPADVDRALELCGLTKFIPSLDLADRWDRNLSLGQQQRVAFARLLLHKPKWVFMDEATSALDEGAQVQMLSLFDKELPNSTILSIAHRPGVEAFHNRTLHLVHTERGAVLFGRQPRRHETETPWPKWLRPSHA
jgi:putative ATP-binding cassette transporter